MRTRHHLTVWTAALLLAACGDPSTELGADPTTDDGGAVTTEAPATDDEGDDEAVESADAADEDGQELSDDQATFDPFPNASSGADQEAAVALEVEVYHAVLDHISSEIGRHMSINPLRVAASGGRLAVEFHEDTRAALDERDDTTVGPVDGDAASVTLSVVGEDNGTYVVLVQTDDLDPPGTQFRVERQGDQMTVVGSSD